MKNIKDYEAMAKLDLSDVERQQVSDFVSKLIESFAALSSVNTDDTEPMYTVLDVCNVFREDVSAKMLTREELLINAPMKHNGFFQVPKTI